LLDIHADVLPSAKFLAIRFPMLAYQRFIGVALARLKNCTTRSFNVPPRR